MKKPFTLAGAGISAAGLVLALVPALPAAADVSPCARMGGNVTILNTPTPTCTLLYTSGRSSIVLPPAKLKASNPFFPPISSTTSSAIAPCS